MNSEKNNYPVTIIGGGMVGLFLAKILAQANINVAIVEANQPILQWRNNQFHSRVSAINAVSQRMLRHINIWSKLNKQSYSPLLALKVWDGVGGAEIDFDSAEVGAPALGAIVDNREIIRVLWQSLQDDPSVKFMCPNFCNKIESHNDLLKLRLDQGKAIHTRLVVGADGVHSWVRDQMPSELKERSYEQSAVVAVVETALPHQQTGWQVFLPNGPLALLPLAKQTQCAIVWSTTPQQANDFVSMGVESFNNEINNAFGLCLGKIKLISGLQAIPLVMRHVKHYVTPRMALIGDAAHTLHPLAGQGVNLGFMDAACLAQCIVEAIGRQHDFASLRTLRRYERWRKGDNSFMLLAMRGFKELFGGSSICLTQARNVGLYLANRSHLLKNCFMRIAMGETSDLPALAKKRGFLK